MFLFKKRDSARRKIIERLYGVIVAQARRPVFYRDLRVPDTVEGRFDLLVLHIHLINARLAADGDAGATFGQELLDYFFDDMDASLREIGIGDLTVPKKMRAMAQAYLGRSAAYAEAMKQGDHAALGRALARNVLADENADGQQLAAYTFRLAGWLHAQPVAPIYSGDITFPDPSEVTSDAA